MPSNKQITVDVMEARKLAWNNSQSPTSYVVVVLGKKKQRTNVRQNIGDPCYKEGFVFELYTTIRELQYSNVWLAVMEPRYCGPPHLLGQADINLGAIWAQPSHKVFHKWAHLTLPQDPNAGLVGFLKVDISITLKEEEVHTLQGIPLSMNENQLEDDILLPSSMEQTRANYMITVHGAFALPSGPYSYGERRYGKPPSTYIRVSFCGLTAKTAVQNGNSHPTYNELVSIVEMFPNASQKIKLEVCSAESSCNRVVASTHLRVDRISHHGENGFLPTFGPSLLHMYSSPCPGSVGYSSEDGPCHRGALLVSLKTIVPFYQHAVRTTSVEPAMPIKTKNLWLLEDFCVFCPILEISMLDRRIAGKSCGVAITIGEIFADVKGNDEFPANEIKLRKLHYTGSMDVMQITPVYGYLEFSHGFPVLQLATKLPDIRFRMYRNNMVHGIIARLEIAITDVETRLKSFEHTLLVEMFDDLNKALDDTAGDILQFLDIIQYSCSSSSSNDNVMQQCRTELDQRQLALQRDEMKRIYRQLSTRLKTKSMMSMDISLARDDCCVINRKTVKILLAESKVLMANLQSLIFKSPDGWPDIVVWLLNAGSRVAYCKISPADIIHSAIPEQNGRHCGQIQTKYFKPLKCPKQSSGLHSACGCIAGKVELLFWMSPSRQNMAFDKYLPAGYSLRTREFDMALKSSGVMMLECRCFLYRAKINTAMETNFACSFVRLHALCSVAETMVKQKCSTPVWNQVLKIRKVVFTTQDRLRSCPPSVLIEVYGSELSGKHELLGRLEVTPTIEDRQELEYAPKLQWYDLKLGEEYIGQVLMSVQILQIPEKIMKTTMYSTLEESVYAENIKEFSSNDDVVPLPATLIPRSTTYKVDIYWWGLRDVVMTRKPCVALETDDLTVKSDIISVTKPNCNFPNGRMSKVFDAPLFELYCSPLNIKLYDSNTFGRTSFVGAHAIKNPNKYLINWMGLSERGPLINTASITSSNFIQVTQTLCIMKRHPSNIDTYSALASVKSNQSIAKISKWRRLFGKKVPDEEEYMLLPIEDSGNKEINQIKVLNKKSLYHRDWWYRYFNSNKENSSSEEDLNTDHITIYTSELESQPEFSKFKDWCTTLKFYNGMKSGIPDKDDLRYCGSLKAGIAIYKWAPGEHTTPVSLSGVDLINGYFTDHPSNDVNKFLVRVYIVKGSNLLASDFTGKSDAYVMVNCGKNVMGDRIDYVPNTANPTFGKLFEFRCTIPDEYLLTVSLYDYESVLPDELIGKTTIDLENRIYTKHRARIGLSSEYITTGPSKWRDPLKPSEILEEICMKNHLAAPVYPDPGTVVVNGVEYRDSDQDSKLDDLSPGSKEKICLSILHKWHTLPLCGHHLVPEHVETRTLYNPDKPGVNQGQIQMWVDIFPLGNGVTIPRPTDIAPKVEEYELRVIVWSVFGVNLENNNKQKNSADICVTAWLGCREQTQSTAVSCGSVKGEARFNWRLIFNFFYQRAENMLLFKEKGPFTEFEERLPPVFEVQVIACDELTPNHCIGSLRFNLDALPSCGMFSQDCTLHKAKRKNKINLFGTGSIRGWWPLETGNHLDAGAIDLEMMLLPKEKAMLIPVGLGRGPPFPLPEPKCQETFSYEFLSKYISSISPRCFKFIVVLGVAMIIISLVIYLEVPIISLKYWFSDADILTDRRRSVRGLCKL